MDVYQTEALEAVEKNFLNFKFWADNSTDREKIYKMIDIVKYSLADNLQIVFSPISAIGQSEVVKAMYENVDFAELFNSYIEIYLTKCNDYLREIGKSLD